MRKGLTLLVLLISFISCDKVLKENDSNVSENSNKDYLLGGDKDEFGCIESAGYTWSILKNDCIRIFDVGYRLNPISQDATEPIISAFVIFNETKDKVELFLPNEKKSIVLDKKSNDLFENENLAFNSKDFYLTIDHVKKYEAALIALKNIDDNHEDDTE